MVIEESGLKFKFSEESKVVKFDDTKFYRREFNTLPGSKGVDFISVNKTFAAFIEVKNCLGDEGNCRWRIFPNNKKRESSHTNVNLEGRDSLDIEVSEKVAMTLAALSGAKSFGDSKSSLDDMRDMANVILGEYLKCDKKRYVVLFLEGEFGGHTRSKKMIMSELQRNINTKLRWFNCKVSVVDSNTYDSTIFQIVR